MGHTEQSTHFGSDAFSLEYRRETPKASITEDIKSYLAEYYLAVPCFQYELSYTPDAFGRFRLVAPSDGEAMTAKCQRAIQKRKGLWKNTSREEAEYQCACSLETQLKTASDGDMIFWTSPPGKPEDGYGTYGFFFEGNISLSANTSSKRISITAFRIENQSVAQCRKAATELVGEPVHFNTAEECISNPKIMRPVDEDTMEHVLTDIFHFTPSPKRQQLFTDVIQIVNPQIDRMIDLIKQSESKEEIQKGFWALENYTISLCDRAERNFDGMVPKRASDVNRLPAVVPFEMLVAYFGQKPPPATAGSCGSTGGGKSSTIFNKISFVTNLFSPESSENFVCPNCHKESTPPVGDSCPKCGITKQEADARGWITC